MRATATVRFGFALLHSPPSALPSQYPSLSPSRSATLTLAQVVVLLESRIGPNVLEALKSKATTLFGLHLHMCTVTTGFDCMHIPEGGELGSTSK